MSLLKKTILILAGTLLVLLIALAIISRQIILADFIALEHQQVSETVDRSLRGLKGEMDNLAGVTADWGVWDDTYQFAVDQNDAYRESNLSELSLLNNELNAMIFLDQTGQMFFGYGADEAGNAIDPPPGLLAFCRENPDLVIFSDPADSLSGLISLPEGPMMVAFQPILASDGQGPVHGTLVMGRFLNQTKLADLGETFNLSLEQFDLKQADLPADVQAAQKSLTAEQPTFVAPIDEQTVAGYGLLTDLAAQPAAIWKIILPRNIYQRGLRSLISSWVFMALAGIAFAILVMVLLQWVVLGRLGRLTEVAQRIRYGEVDVTLMPDNQKDEISRLTEVFGDIVHYLQGGASAALRLASGDLTIEIKPNSDKDVLANAFKDMVIGWRTLITQVTEAAIQVDVTARQLASVAGQTGGVTVQVAETIQQIAQGAARQTQGMNQAALAVNQVSRAIDGVAKGAEEQAEAVSKSSTLTGKITGTLEHVVSDVKDGAQNSSQAAEAAQNGAAIIGQTIQNMEQIRAKVDYSAASVQEMGRRSQQIGLILETIDDIASQTNLLALNAAIEAARAGEHGKGFSVVADEVRKLAEKSAAATGEIAQLIRTIQSTVATAVQSMDAGSVEVQKGVAQADKAAQALQSLLQTIQATAQQSHTIATAAESINVHATELVEAMDVVSTVVEQNTIAAQEVAGGSAEMAEVIRSVTNAVQDNSAAVQEVTAAVQEVTAQVQEVSASAHHLSHMASMLKQSVQRFTLK